MFMTNRVFQSAALSCIVGLAMPAAGQVINENYKLLASDGAAQDRFGGAIDIDDGMVAVGAWGHDDNGNYSGSAYLYDLSTGTQISELLSSDGTEFDYFGYSIALDDGIVAVGAYQNDVFGSDSGAVYLFNAATGAQTAKLSPKDAGAFDEFGYSVAMDGGIVAIGAWHFDWFGVSSSGGAYLFDASTGLQLYRLLPTDGFPQDEFGNSIAISDGTVVVGAHFDDDNGTNSGSAYIFDAATGTQLWKLIPNDGAAGDQFGHAVASANGIIVVGAPFHAGVASNSGAIYVFDASTGNQLMKLMPSDSASGDVFGTSVSIDDDVIGVGATLDDDNGSSSGSAYLFDASTGIQITKLLPTDGAGGNYFGSAIAVKNGEIGVGAVFDEDLGSKSGSAYMFTMPGADCPGDFNDDMVLDFFDVADFLSAFSAGDLLADYDPNGTLDFFDVAAFLDAFSYAYNNGCP